MCRWNAFFGQPLVLEELLSRTEHSLIESPGIWIEVPESTALVTQPDVDEQVRLQPRRPSPQPA